MFTSGKMFNQIETFKDLNFGLYPYDKQSSTEKEMEDLLPNSMDFWKSLLPTPPRSPQHESQTGSDMDLMLNLDMVSGKLEEHLYDSPSNSDTDISNDCCLSSDELQANLIQDCMWSAPGLHAVGLTVDSYSSQQTNKTQDTSSLLKNLDCSALDINSDECVDPAAVFPYPLNVTKRNPLQAPTQDVTSRNPLQAPTLLNVLKGMETPSESGKFLSPRRCTVRHDTSCWRVVA